MDRILRRPLALTAVCVALFGLVLWAAYVPARGQWLDAAGLAGFVDLQSRLGWDVMVRLARLGDPLPVGLAGAMLGAIALARGRPRLAAGVLLLLAATSVSSQLLKLLLAHPRYSASIPAGGYVAPQAFPSGHATGAMSLALAAVLVAPRRLRPPAALLGAAFAVAVGFSVVSLGWHFPSDVVGGYLLATGWALVLVAALRRTWRREPARVRGAPRGRGLELGVAGIALVTLAIVAATATHLAGAGTFPRDHTAFVTVAAAVATAALALPAGVAATLRRS